ncbi:hypothetical protein FisN_29Lu002 [Fistulifera solaris]|uniref:Uncharacterized protein n=1 Tax=Fistulifera solaris TaxID=1519565 RepID=A0A1Z5JLB3_FISSO|nr:hypothetical protein FisN_29Lu002 [Fistulifera solaris]|eukprot:GAX14803.1 hypothetical protein FisN_29Lu002 [Fistulifera solaris]
MIPKDPWRKCSVSLARSIAGLFGGNAHTKNYPPNKTMNAIASKERTNMFLDRLSFPSSHVEKRDHRMRPTHETAKAIHCARRMLGTSYKRRMPSHISPFSCWIDFTNTPNDCDSDISVSEEEDEDGDDHDIIVMRESRWSSTPCPTSKTLLLRDSPKPLRKALRLIRQ